jgi:hypothetical protein
MLMYSMACAQLVPFYIQSSKMNAINFSSSGYKTGVRFVRFNKDHSLILSVMKWYGTWYFRISFVILVYFIPNHCFYLHGSTRKDIDENKVWKYPAYYLFLIILCSCMSCLLSNPSVVPHSYFHFGDETTQLPICWGFSGRIYNLKVDLTLHLMNRFKSRKSLLVCTGSQCIFMMSIQFTR